MLLTGKVPFVGFPMERGTTNRMIFSALALLSRPGNSYQSFSALPCLCRSNSRSNITSKLAGYTTTISSHRIQLIVLPTLSSDVIFDRRNDSLPSSDDVPDFLSCLKNLTQKRKEDRFRRLNCTHFYTQIGTGFERLWIRRLSFHFHLSYQERRLALAI